MERLQISESIINFDVVIGEFLSNINVYKSSLTFCSQNSRLWKQDAIGVDCGNKVADWLSEILFDEPGKTRLIYRGHWNWSRKAYNPQYYNFPQFNQNDKV